MYRLARPAVERGNAVSVWMEPATFPNPTTRDRTWWLVRFDDQEIAELASFMFGRRPDRERIRSERERLLGVMGRAGRVVARDGRLGHYRHKRYRV
jgi:hypothetical protein